MAAKYVRWTKSEDEILIRHFYTMGCAVRKHLKERSDPSILSRAKQLGLKYDGGPDSTRAMLKGFTKVPSYSGETWVKDGVLIHIGGV